MLITPSAPPLERVARFQALQAGQYWRSLCAVPEQGIEVGEVLLICSIRWVDEAPHTIILRPHPDHYGKTVYLKLPKPDGGLREVSWTYDEHRFLFKDFLEKFEFEPDHQRIRQDEVRRIQGRVTALQAELVESQTDPAKLAAIVEAGLREQKPASPPHTSTLSAPAAGLPAPDLAHRHLIAMGTGTVAEAIGLGITETNIEALKAAAHREHQIATIKSQWIQNKTNEIGAALQAMTPYYAEQAAAALAQTEDTRSYVAKLIEGIESLDLYVGKDVEVKTIRTGPSAPRHEPLTFVQRKLLMDEELAVWTDVDEWFDFSSEELFFEALCAHEGLIDQIFPAPRCVVVMASTRRYINYGDRWVSHQRNAENRKVFLLVRDGLNVYRVFSPVESHLGTAKLFPSKNDQEAVFRGLDGAQIRFDDVAYSDHLAKHESYALHYKRFLLLACGLDHRLKLFGDFYEGPTSLDFVSLAFQEKYCRFLHDDDGEGLLPVENRPTVQAWIQAKNGYLRSGSRVLCQWRELMNPDTAPSACKANARHDGFDFRYYPAHDLDILIAYQEGASLCVDIPVSGYSYECEERTFNCKVNLSKFRMHHWKTNDLPWLCLDAVSPEDLRWYIQNRGNRQDHLYYIRFFKRALRFIEQERLEEQPTRLRLLQALEDGRIATGAAARDIVDQTVIAWRSAQRGKPLPHATLDHPAKVWKTLLDQMYLIAGTGQQQADQVAEFVRGLGYEPLRLIVSGANRLVMYAAPRPEERDDRLVPHRWVHRIVLERTKTGFAVKNRRWVHLPKSTASETTLHEWEAAAIWLSGNDAFASYEHKQNALAVTEHWVDRLEPFTRIMTPEEYATHLADWKGLREHLMQRSRYVVNPIMAVPIGLSRRRSTGETHYLCLCATDAHALLHRSAPDEEARARIQKAFCGVYRSQTAADTKFKSALEGIEMPWYLAEIAIEAFSTRRGVFFHGDVLPVGRRNHFDPLLATAYAHWRKELETIENGRIWLADGVLDSAGHFSLDPLLGIQRCENYCPTLIYQIQVFGDGGMKLHSWYDVCAPDIDLRTLSAGLTHYQGYGDVFPSREAALEMVRTAGPVVSAAERPSAPQPPAGVERWFRVQP